MRKVCVEWIDAESHDDWEPIDEFLLESKLAKIESVGHLVQENTECIILALNYDEKNNMASQYITIPMPYVVEVFELTKARSAINR